MHRRAIYFLFPCSFVFLLSCGDRVVAPGDDGSSPETFRHLDIKYLSGMVSLNLMPSVPPQKILTARFVLLMKNTDTAKVFDGLTIPRGDLFIHSSLTPVTTIPFSTSWDGHLDPREQDTVRLANIDSLQVPFNPPCDQIVYLNLHLIANPKNSKLIVTDSLRVTCTF